MIVTWRSRIFKKKKKEKKKFHVTCFVALTQLTQESETFQSEHFCSSECVQVKPAMSQ